MPETVNIRREEVCLFWLVVLEVSFQSIALGLGQSRTSWWGVSGDRAASLVSWRRQEGIEGRDG